jgi:hypothetical protein
MRMSSATRTLRARALGAMTPLASAGRLVSLQHVTRPTKALYNGTGRPTEKRQDQPRVRVIGQATRKRFGIRAFAKLQR